MNYEHSKYLKIPKYEWSSSGKHGNRYKQGKPELIPIVRLFVNTCQINQADFQTLCLLSHFLDEPLRYKNRKAENKQSIAYIELAAAEDVEKLE